VELTSAHVNGACPKGESAPTGQSTQFPGEAQNALSN
jgi:hypothetical protein